MKIILQVGHQNIKYNSIVDLRGHTGAPNELGYNIAIVSRCCEILRQKGFEVKQTDANANDDAQVTKIDWDLFLACHCDSDAPQISGGFTDYADPASDLAAPQSQRIADAIAAEYFHHSEITERKERRGNPNVRFYYMWKYLTAKTPCALIEMGESVDPHDGVLLRDTERIATALARGVCNAFGVQYDTPPPVEPPVQPPVTPPPTEPPIQPPACDCSVFENKLKAIKDLIWGKGLPWVKINRLKELLPK